MLLTGLVVYLAFRGLELGPPGRARERWRRVSRAQFLARAQ